MHLFDSGAGVLSAGGRGDAEEARDALEVEVVRHRLALVHPPVVLVPANNKSNNQ